MSSMWFKDSITLILTCGSESDEEVDSKVGEDSFSPRHEVEGAVWEAGS